DTLMPWKSLKFSHPASVELSMKFTYDDGKKATMMDEALIDSGTTRNYTAQEFRRLTFDHKPFKEKIDTFLLDSLLHQRLMEKKIPVEFSYAMTRKGVDSIVYGKLN